MTVPEEYGALGEQTEDHALPPAQELQPAPPASVANRQHVGRGIAVGRDIHGDVYVTVQDTDEEIARPRFREGPYPTEEVTERLDAFVAPDPYPEWRTQLSSRRVLFLVGEARTGTTTTALSLLHEVTGGKQITGLDPEDDLAGWTPTSASGYLVQGLGPDAGASLNEVTLRQIVQRLETAHAHLLVVVSRATGLARALDRWSRRYEPPAPAAVAHHRLERMAARGLLTPDQARTAISSLGEAPFKEYLSASQFPGAGVEVAEELWQIVANGRSTEAAVDNFRLAGSEDAAQLLATVADSADALALTATIALLEDQDRSVIERFSARLRVTLLAGRAPGAPAPEQPLLGRSFTDRLESVQAQLRPREIGRSRGYRFWAQPVAFKGRHLAEEVLERLWLDHEGFSDVLTEWLLNLPHEPGLGRIAGPRIGRVICHASGPSTLRQLKKFAMSKLVWHRQLVGHALAEAVQDVVLSGAVRSLLREWGRLSSPAPRCTVAETCAGSLGLALPDFALSLLSDVLAGPEDRLDDQVGKAVTAAFGVLLTETANRPKVLNRLTAWLGEPHGTARRAYATRAVEGLCGDGFPSTSRAGVRRLTLADLFEGEWEHIVTLTLGALNDNALHPAVGSALQEIERSASDGRERMDAFLTALVEASGGHQGLRGFLLATYRTRTSTLDGPVLR